MTCLTKDPLSFYACFFWFAIRFPRDSKKSTWFWCISGFLKPPPAKSDAGSQTQYSLPRWDSPASSRSSERKVSCSLVTLFGPFLLSCCLSCLGATFVPDKHSSCLPCFSTLQMNPNVSFPSSYIPCHTFAPIRTSCESPFIAVLVKNSQSVLFIFFNHRTLSLEPKLDGKALRGGLYLIILCIPRAYLVS